MTHPDISRYSEGEDLFPDEPAKPADVTELNNVVASNEKMLKRVKERKPRNPGWLMTVLSTSIVTTVVSGMFGLGGHLIDRHDELSGKAPSICLSAIQNVESALEKGIRAPVLLERLNSETTDSQCGEETDIAADILKNKPSSEPSR